MHRQVKSLLGKTFKNLKVTAQAMNFYEASGNERSSWVCVCKTCGTEQVVVGRNLERRIHDHCINQECPVNTGKRHKRPSKKERKE